MVDIKLGPEPKVVCIPAEYKTSTSNPPSISVNMTALGQALSNPKPIMPNGTMHGSRNEVSVLVINTGGTIGMKSHGDGNYLSMFSDEPGESRPITFMNHLMDYLFGHLGCRQWCSLLYCSGYTVMIRLVQTRPTGTCTCVALMGCRTTLTNAGVYNPLI